MNRKVVKRVFFLSVKVFKSWKAFTEREYTYFCNVLSCSIFKYLFKSLVCIERTLVKF